MMLNYSMLKHKILNIKICLQISVLQITSILVAWRLVLLTIRIRYSN